jgi:hypothetical protein
MRPNSLILNPSGAFIKLQHSGNMKFSVIAIADEVKNINTIVIVVYSQIHENAKFRWESVKVKNVFFH